MLRRLGHLPFPALALQDLLLALRRVDDCGPDLVPILALDQQGGVLIDVLLLAQPHIAKRLACVPRQRQQAEVHDRGCPLVSMDKPLKENERYLVNYRRPVWKIQHNEGVLMPEISRFFGIIIRMFYDEHNPPHFHAEFQSNKAVFDFVGNILMGDLCSKTATKLVREWVDLRVEELKRDWSLAKSGERIEKIAPLD